MPREEFLSFERVFGLNRSERESIFFYNEWSIAESVYRVACDEIPLDKNDSDNDSKDDCNYECNDGYYDSDYECNDGYVDDDDSDYECNNGYDEDNDSVQSFDEQIEAVMDSLKRVVELFEKSSRAKDAFLEKFHDCSSCQMDKVLRLKEIAEEIQANKLHCDIAKVAGNALGTVGGIMTLASLFTPLAAVTLPLTISGIAVITCARMTEFVVLKSKVEEAKTLVMEDKLNFSAIVDPWFIHTKELKVAIESLVSYSLLKEMSPDLQGFHEMNAANRCKQVLKLCIRKMLKFSNIIESFGVVYAPVVMTFVIVICLLRHHNWIVLDCTMQTDRLEKIRRSTNDPEKVERNSLVTGLAAVAEIVINVLDMVLTSIDIYNCPEVEDAKKIKEAAELLEDELLFVESVYDELWEKEPIIHDYAEFLTESDVEEFHYNRRFF